MTIVGEFGKIVFEHDGFGSDTYRDAHVCIVFWLHGCFEVEVFEIGGYEFAIEGGDDTVEQGFDC